MERVAPRGAPTLAVRRLQVGLVAVGTVLVAVAVWSLLSGAAPARTAVEATPVADAADVSSPATTAAPELDPIVTGPPTDLAPVEAPASEPEPAPVGIEIPRIGVDSTLTDIDIDASRRLDAPADPGVAGWYVRSPRPGEDGPALIAGHVDSKAGPGVFYRLHELEPGDKISVEREDGSRAEFVVRKLGRWSKDQVPVDEVYRKADGSELRLITCGGEFDRDRGSYRDNVVVFASTLTSPVASEPRHTAHQA